MSKNRFNLLPSESTDHSRRWRGGTRGGNSRLHLLSPRRAETGTLHLAVRAEPAAVIPSSFLRLLGGATATGRTPSPPSWVRGQDGLGTHWDGAGHTRTRGAPATRRAVKNPHSSSDFEQNTGIKKPSSKIKVCRNLFSTAPSRGPLVIPIIFII